MSVHTVIVAVVMSWCVAGDAPCREYVGAVVSTASIAAAEHRISARLLLAVGIVESRLDDSARSSVAWGLYQLHEHSEWGKRAWIACHRYGATRYACLREQAWQASRVLRHERARCGSWQRALSAYNTGRCNSTSGLRYAHKVMRWWRRLESAQ